MPPWPMYRKNPLKWQKPAPESPPAATGSVSPPIAGEEKAKKKKN